MPTAKIEVQSLWADCQDCARGVYENTAPNAKYADSVARLLLGTAAKESDGFKARRQYGFDWLSDRGAWGAYQTEKGSAAEGQRMLATRPALADNAAEYLFQQKHADMSPILSLTPSELLRLISGWDRLACLFARLHYLRVPSAVPLTLEEQAKYWKKFYNTKLGKGTAAQYVKSWNAHCAAIVKP